MDINVAIAAIIAGSLLLIVLVVANVLVVRAKASMSPQPTESDVSVLDDDVSGIDGEVSRIEGNVSGINAMEVLDALQVYIWRGILAAEKIAAGSMTGIALGLTGADKAKIAGQVYDLLPEIIHIDGVPFDIYPKKYISRDDFNAAIERIYREGAAFMYKNVGWLRKAVDDVIPGDDMVSARYKPPAPPATGGSEIKDVDHPVAGKG